MGDLRPNILHCIGGASLLALRKVTPRNGARILLKLESENPTGSMKDRIALAMIEAAAMVKETRHGRPRDSSGSGSPLGRLRRRRFRGRA
jgi:cysteine synthase